ncbi:MAG: hypothetical protein ACE5I7_17465 [Candidatus Binatia bacterium]
MVLQEAAGRRLLSILSRCALGSRFVLVALLIAVASAAAAEFGPQGVVRQFCRADGLGQRLSTPGWAAFAPIVQWRLEPAWDHIVLISGYTVDSPRPAGHGVFEVEARFNVLAELSAVGLETAVHVERIRFRVRAPGQAGWRIIGPPPPPHVFANRVDVDRMRRSFERGGWNVVPDSLFVWQMFRATGWNVPFQRTTDLVNGTAYRVVEHPRAGDVVVYLRNGSPYHAGLLEAEDRVMSSTLNAGIVRAATAAFAGDVRYVRLVQPEPALAAEGSTSRVSAVTGLPLPAQAPRRIRRKTPPAAHRHRKRRKVLRRPAKPSVPRRVKTRRTTLKRPRVTPVIPNGPR